MKRKSQVLGCALIMTLLVLTSSCKKTEGTKIHLLSYIPDNASAVFTVNFEKFAKMELFDKFVSTKSETKKDNPLFKNYQEFVDKTGVNPKTDIKSMAMGLYGPLKENLKNFVFIIDVNYDKEKIISLLKQKGKIEEENHQKSILYKMLDDPNSNLAITFIENNIIAVGKIDYIRQVIELKNKKALSPAGQENSILKNNQMKPFIDKMKNDSLLSFVVKAPEEIKTAPQNTSMPIQFDVSKIEWFYGYFDYEDGTISGDFIIYARNEEGNKQTADQLNSFKAMGTMAGPEVAELLNNISITAASDQIKFSFSFTEELIKKIERKFYELQPRKRQEREMNQSKDESQQ